MFTRLTVDSSFILNTFPFLIYYMYLLLNSLGHFSVHLTPLSAGEHR